MNSCSGVNIVDPAERHRSIPVETISTAVATLMCFQSLNITFKYWWVGALIGVLPIAGTIYQFCFEKAKPGKTEI